MNLLLAIRLGLISAATLSAAVAYTFYLSNVQLANRLDIEIATSEGLRIARTKDSVAHKRLLASMIAEQEALATRLNTLSEIQDETGRTYLDSIVPDSIRSVLND